ncbi:MAG TPA: vanadium-dependent haloperoxidase [Terriglobales bacterium]|nr:vanadium-dependent haloperoxidase [Terriglobales bacterium]
MKLSAHELSQLEPSTAIREQDAIRNQDQTPKSSSRRSFLGSLGGAAAAAMTVGSIVTLEPAVAGKSGEARADEIGPLPDQARADASFNLRVNQATTQHNLPLVAHPANNDEYLYADKGASFSKCLPHDNYGRVDLNAYAALINALTTGNPSDFAAIPLGGSRTLTNPQGGLAFDLEGTDGHNLTVDAAPAMASSQLAAEMVEMYWAALLRDIGFSAYSGNSLANQAAAELNALSGYAGPRNSSGQVTTNELFRGSFAGETIGPYVSQFMALPTYLGVQPIAQRFQTFLRGVDYLTDFNSYVLIQNGGSTGDAVAFDSVFRHVRNGRDLAAWTHVDVLYQAYFVALLVLQSIGAPVNPGNPYATSSTQAGFGTFGPPDFAATVGEVASRALQAVWFQKWFVHRRARPEVPGAIAHLIRTGQGGHTDVTLSSDMMNSKALTNIFKSHGSYLLPQAFPEGAPTHPSYPTGHGTVGGACITVLKFFFDGNFVIPNPMVSTASGTALTPYTDSPLTIQGELNKLGHNVTFGHGIHPGIHYRSDSDESLILGEALALSILQDKASTYNEKFTVNLTKFDGTTATISNQ